MSLRSRFSLSLSPATRKKNEIGLTPSRSKAFAKTKKVVATAELSVLAEQSAVVYPQFRVCSVCILACVTGSDETDETTSNQGHSERIKPKVHALTHLENFLKPLSHDVLGFRVSII